ncbi:BglII/BstYI family type II restriction endonuclease [Candidatus Neomarinimicrobiota bacterium]
MKIESRYNHLSAVEIIKSKSQIAEEVESIFNNSTIKFFRGLTKSTKKDINTRFNNYGWADKIRVGTERSRLTISFLKSRVGICVQFGNVSRTYADILKLCYLGNNGIIDAGIIAVPSQVESRKLGTNYARYDRLEREFELFRSIINIPVLVLGLSN